MNVGFIGLGIMGSRMAANLQGGGHDLTVHNRTKSKADELVAGGATWAETAAAAAQGAQVLITMLAHPDAVREMAFTRDGFLEAMAPETIWVDCSTVNPSFSREMALEAKGRGVRFIDAPAAGTKGPAAEGTLLFLVGGTEEDVEAVRPLLQVMGRAVIHMGDVGMGASAKMVANALLAQAMLSFAEGLVLGESLGLERERLLQMLVGGPVVAPFIEGKRAKIESDDYEAAFPLKWMQKDLHLATQTGYEQGVAMPSANLAKEIYRLADRAGLGELDFSAIYRFMAESESKSGS